MPVAFDTIDRPDVITDFVETAVDLVGREDENLTSKNHDENLFSEDYAKTQKQGILGDPPTSPQVLRHHSHLCCNQ